MTLVEITDPLEDLQLELAFMKEFKLSQRDAAQAAEWLRDERHVDSLDCWDNIWSRWEDELDNYIGDGYGFQGFVFGEVSDIIQDKYGIEV